MRVGFLLLWLTFASGRIFAQCSSTPVTITQKGSAAFALPKECMSAVHDELGKSYLYVAGKERGLLIYDVSNVAAPFVVDSIKVSDMLGLEAMSVTQAGNYVYVALGNVFSNSSLPGMAIIDVEYPTHPVLKGVWKYFAQSGGAGIVKVEGNYAYLGAMRRGLMILDVSDKMNPSLVSVFKPSISYPNPTNPDSLKYNARGMAVRNSIVYLCDDAGGLRVIDATNKSTPVEIGKYANPAVYNRPRAYNNVILDDTLLYVAVDYCGMEVLSVANVSNIRLVGWWNPWHCESFSNTWFNSGGHTNEIQYSGGCKTVFLSSGKSEINVVNVANPASPDSCTRYTTPGGNVGVWGLSLYRDELYACYIYVPLGIPFYSNWSGVKTFTWNNCAAAGIQEVNSTHEVELYPNPSDGSFRVRLPSGVNGGVSIAVYNLVGVKIFDGSFDGIADPEVGAANMVPGSYLVAVKYNGKAHYKRLTIIR